MESEQTLKKYIGPSKAAKIGAWVLLAATIACIVGGLVISFVQQQQRKGRAQQWYVNDSPKGSIAYLDIVGVSDWLVKYGDDTVYYSAEDAEGYLYTVRLTKAQHRAMKEQQKYWEREDENAPIPAPYRVYGKVSGITSTIRSDLCEAWDMTKDEYDEYFGKTFLNCTNTASDNGAFLYIFAFLFGIFALCLFINNGSINRAAKRSLKRLEELGLTDRAAQQLEQPVASCKKDQGRITAEFLFGKGTGVAMALKDVRWAYRKTMRTNFVPTNDMLMVGDGRRGAFMAVNLGRHDEEDINQLLIEINVRNPETLLGYSSEAIKAYRELRRSNL